MNNAEFECKECGDSYLEYYCARCGSDHIIACDHNENHIKKLEEENENLRMKLLSYNFLIKNGELSIEAGCDCL